MYRSNTREDLFSLGQINQINSDQFNTFDEVFHFEPINFRTFLINATVFANLWTIPTRLKNLSRNYPHRTEPTSKFAAISHARYRIKHRRSVRQSVSYHLIAVRSLYIKIKVRTRESVRAIQSDRGKVCEARARENEVTRLREQKKEREKESEGCERRGDEKEVSRER